MEYVEGGETTTLFDQHYLITRLDLIKRHNSDKLVNYQSLVIDWLVGVQAIREDCRLLLTFLPCDSHLGV
jgi:hypothetical protein